ncbi:hypothetical protein GCM10020229_42350 [Kitasatospora albolonga]|uniref:WXG100-like domain-containing protein n=1 Tax=Kitasatospora albolonga TaxID=68173 RepID=UPI0031EB88BD
MIQLPPDLAEVLKVIQSNEDGKAIVFPDANEDLIGDLALAWEKWNTFAETRVGAIVANAKLAMEAMEGEAAESFAGYLRKFCEGDASHVTTTVTAANAIAQSLRGAIEAVTQTKNEMIRELQYTKEYIEDNPAGKNDDIAKSEGIKEAVATYNTYVGQVGNNVDSMLRQGSGHFQAMTAAAEVASLTGGSGGGGGGGGTGAPPRTGLDGVSTVNTPNVMQTGLTMPGGVGAPAPVDIQGFNPGGVGPGGLGGPGGLPGGGTGMPGGAPGGGTGGAPALQPFKMPTAQAPTPFSSASPALSRSLGSGSPGSFGSGGTGGSSLGPDGKPSFKLPSAGTPGGLTLAGHQPPNTEGTTTGQLRPMTALRPFTPGGSEPGSIGGIGGLPLGSRGGTGGTPLSPLTGRPAGLPGGTLPSRSTPSTFSPGGRTPGSIGGSGGTGSRIGGGGSLGGSGLGGGARVGGAGGGGSALGAFNPGGGRSAGGLGGSGAHPLGTPTTAGGVGGRGVGGTSGTGLGAGGVGASGAAGAAGTSARGMAGGGMPGMPGMGAGHGGSGAGKSGSRFVRPTRFGVEEDEEEPVALRDAGILGQAVHHDPQDRHWQRMRQRWVEESGMAPAPEPVHTAVAGVGQEAPAAGGDFMSQLSAAVLGPEAAATLNATSESGGSGSGSASGGETTATPAAGTTGSSDDAYLERARSVAERRGRTDEDAPTLEPAAAAAPAAPADGPPPLREEGGFQVPTPFMRAALARLATSGGFPEGSGEAPAAPAGASGAATGQGR